MSKHERIQATFRKDYSKTERKVKMRMIHNEGVQAMNSMNIAENEYA